MKTEQEKYYERKNREAEQNGQTIAYVALSVIAFFLCYWLWPLWLFCVVLFGTGYFINYMKNLIVDSATTLFNFIFRRRQINKDLLDLLDSLAILSTLLFVIVIAIGISLK